MTTPNIQKLELPVSGYEVVEKILYSYALSGEKDVSLDEVASRAGMNKTQLSKNHPFLVCVGVLEGGQKKHLTLVGQRLALAISHKDKDETSRAWAEVMRNCEHTRKVLDMIRIQGEWGKHLLAGKILQTLGMPNTKSIKTGANSLIDVFLRANLIQEAGTNYQFNDSFDSTGLGVSDISPAVEPSSVIYSQPIRGMAEQVEPSIQNTLDPSVHIDIQIHIDSSASTEQIDQIFASMAKHLYGRA